MSSLQNLHLNIPFANCLPLNSTFATGEPLAKDLEIYVELKGKTSKKN